MSPKRRAKAVRTRTEGVVLLRAIVKKRGIAEVARKVKVTEVAVRHWCDEQRRPAADARLLLLKFFDIALESWTLVVGAKLPVKPKGVDVADVVIDPGTSAKELARMQVTRIATRLARAERDEMSSREISPIESSYTHAVRLFSRLSGELEITESALLRSTAWGRVKRVLHDVFDRHPAAARDFAQAIAGLENPR
jgi:hypothetical protein